MEAEDQAVQGKEGAALAAVIPQAAVKMEETGRAAVVTALGGEGARGLEAAAARAAAGWAAALAGPDLAGLD